MKPLLSILIAHYNQGGEILRALNSVKGLTVPYEICIYDDGSNEENRKLLGSSIEGNDNVELHLCDSNFGHIPKSRNQTLRMATGKYVVVLDADDAIVPEGIEAQIKFLEEHEQYGWCHAPAFIYRPGGQWTGVYLLSIPEQCARGVDSWSHNVTMELHPEPSAMVPEAMLLFEENLKYSFINNWGCVIRRSLMEFVGGWSEDLPGNGCGEDYDLNLKLARNSIAKWIGVMSYKFTKDENKSHEKWDFVDGEDLGPFSNYSFIEDKHKALATPKIWTQAELIERVREIKGQQSKRALDIGCGSIWAELPGYLVDRCDSRGETGATIICDAEWLNYTENGVYDKVYASHVLEHFPRWKGAIILREWLRVLKVGGEIEIRVPDIMSLARNILDSKSNDHDIHCQLFGAHTNAYDEHHAFYTCKTLTQLMESLGCEVTYCICDNANGPNTTYVGTKLREPAEDSNILLRTSHKSRVSITEQKIEIGMTFSEESKGSEMVVVFSDKQKLHHFRWSCTLNGGFYSAALSLTNDIKRVLGLWDIDIWCNGQNLKTLEFELVEKEQTTIDQALEEYQSEG